MLVACRAFADHVGGLEELAPATLARTHEAARALDERGPSRLGHARPALPDHDAIVASRASAEQLCGAPPPLALARASLPRLAVAT